MQGAEEGAWLQSCGGSWLGGIFHCFPNPGAHLVHLSCQEIFVGQNSFESRGWNFEGDGVSTKSLYLNIQVVISDSGQGSRKLHAVEVEKNTLKTTTRV